MKHAALAGLDGWYRWSSWSAHFFTDGEQLCNIRHDNFNVRGIEPTRPSPAELTPNGQPYGRVCAICLKRSREVTDRKEGSHGST